MRIYVWIFFHLDEYTISQYKKSIKKIYTADMSKNVINTIRFKKWLLTTELTFTALEKIKQSNKMFFIARILCTMTSLGRWEIHINYLILIYFDNINKVVLALVDAYEANWYLFLCFCFFNWWNANMGHLANHAFLTKWTVIMRCLSRLAVLSLITLSIRIVAFKRSDPVSYGENTI